VDGRAAYVIEVTVVTPSYYKNLFYFDQESGMLTKTVMLNFKGQCLTSYTLTNLKLDVDINPDRFVFKAPEGVEIRDMTAPQEAWDFQVFP